jgi:hypothetical protein
MVRRVAVLLVLLFAAAPALAGAPYPWRSRVASGNSLRERLRPPRGYEFEETRAGSFAEWLSRLPLKPGRPPVYLYDGRRKSNQSVHAAVLDLDVGREDLQQCADSVIRLRAEYLYSRRRTGALHFNFTSGARADFSRWAEGYRPTIVGSRVSWQKTAEPDASYASFRAYLRLVFAYAGTASLARELTPVSDPRRLRAGDVFITPGSPGHVVLVVATCVNARGRRLFLLAQGYMPAQDMHVLKNPLSPGLSPWYEIPSGDRLVTPEWTFRVGDLRRFAE